MLRKSIGGKGLGLETRSGQNKNVVAFIRNIHIEVVRARGGSKKPPEGGSCCLGMLINASFEQKHQESVF